jgi:LPS export ABC transporter protein LptC
MKNVIALSFLFLGLLLSFSSCQNNRNEVMAIGNKIILPSQTGKDITMLYSDSTILKMKLQAPEMQKFEINVARPVTIMPKGLYVVFYDNNGKETTTLKSNYGIRYDDTHKMEVKYNVEVVNATGEKLNTEHLVWDEKTKKITSDAFVKITTAREIIMGKGLEANQDFSQYEIKEITGSIRIEDGNL